MAFETTLSTSPGSYDSSDVVRAPAWPLYVSIGAAVLSLLLSVTGFNQPASSRWIFGAVGYLLTPLVSAIMLVMARSAHLHRIARQADVYDQVTGERLQKRLTLLVIIAFVISVIPIFFMAEEVGQFVSNLRNG